MDYPQVGCDRKELVRRAEARARVWRRTEDPPAGPDELLGRAVVYEYNRLLHAAAQMDDRTAVQDRAMTEVWNYITPIVWKYLHDGSRVDECANEALLIIWEHSGDVRDPGSFLAYAAIIAQRLAWRRGDQAQVEVPLQGEEADDGDEATVDPPDPVQTDPIQTLLQTEARATLVSAVQACLKRMRHGARVIIGEFLDDRRPEEVAAALGLTLNYVYGIKRRALLRLRDCPGFAVSLAGLLGREQGGGETC